MSFRRAGVTARQTGSRISMVQGYKRRSLELETRVSFRAAREREQHPRCGLVSQLGSSGDSIATLSHAGFSCRRRSMMIPPDAQRAMSKRAGSTIDS
jgi:hypothetical protein